MDARSWPMNFAAWISILWSLYVIRQQRNVPLVGQRKTCSSQLPDPAKTDDINDFRKVRDAMEHEIIYLLVNYAD